MDQFTVTPIGRVESDFSETDDGTGATLRATPSTIVVSDSYEEALTNFDDRIGTDESSLLDVIFYFDDIDETTIELASESSEGLTSAGIGGVFTRRTPRRLNKFGLTTVRVLECKDRRLRVAGLDALDGTPVLDLKPHINWKAHFE